MIEPQQLQDGRMEVADVHWVLGNVVRELVGLTDECFVRLSLVQCLRLRGCRPNSPAKDVVFVPARADATTAIDRPWRRERSVSGPTSRSVRASTSDFPWQILLIWGSVALVLILTAIAFLAPDGTWLVGVSSWPLVASLFRWPISPEPTERSARMSSTGSFTSRSLSTQRITSSLVGKISGSGSPVRPWAPALS